MSRYIDADKLPINILDLTYYDGSRVRVVTVEDIDDAPSIKTKQIKYYDESESVWKIGEVIVDEQMD